MIDTRHKSHRAGSDTHHEVFVGTLPSPVRLVRVRVRVPMPGIEVVAVVFWERRCRLEPGAVVDPSLAGSWDSGQIALTTSDPPQRE